MIPFITFLPVAFVAVALWCARPVPSFEDELVALLRGA